VMDSDQSKERLAQQCLRMADALVAEKCEKRAMQ